MTSPATSQPRTVIVANPRDDAIAGCLAGTGGLAAGRAVIRPTPGATDPATLALDLLAAAGASPRPGHQDHVPARLHWSYAQAWLAGHQVTDLICDRAHRLSTGQLTALGALAARLGASLWLMWGSTADPAPAAAALEHAARRPARQISLHELPAQLHPAPQLPPPAGEQAHGWPPLPEADFITFLAACRRLLPAASFASLAGVYYDTAASTDIWAAAHRQLAAESMTRYTAVLTGWLRDDILGPAPAAPVALVRLRAAQAALFTAGILLRWDAAALGPEPAARLPGDLTPARAALLCTLGIRTDIAAATALCLHLNRPATDLWDLSVGDVAPDGSALAEPGSRQDPVTMPTAARPVIAAQLAWRRSQGAAEGAPYFTHPTDPSPSAPTRRWLRNAVTRASRTLGCDLPWMHACTDQADLGLGRPVPSWLAERGLTVYRIDPAVSDQIPRRRDYYRPSWLNPPGPAQALQAAARPAPPAAGLYHQRLAATGLSPAELGGLAGIHPHLLSSPPDLGGQPARVLVELARALQLHPADLYPDLASVTAQPSRTASQNPSAGARADALTLLTALACARTPLGAGDLAGALDWPLPRVTAALDRASHDPNLGGPMMLRRVPPHTWALSPRPGVLTARQQQAITSAARSSQMLTNDEATVLLAALAFGPRPRYASFRETHPDGEHTLKESGLLRSTYGPHRVVVSNDVGFSLRYTDGQHLATERAEHWPTGAPALSGNSPRPARRFIPAGSPDPGRTSETGTTSHHCDAQPVTSI